MRYLDECCADETLDPQLRWMFAYYHASYPMVFRRFLGAKELQRVLNENNGTDWRNGDPLPHHLVGRGLMGRFWTQVITSEPVNAEPIDPNNPVVALCAEAMAIEGTGTEAKRLFERAWAIRRDDYDAAIAAHFLARHQPTLADTLHWNTLAVHHAEAVEDDRAKQFMASLYLNLADAQANVGDLTSAAISAERATHHLTAVPVGGYHDLIAFGIRRLRSRL